MGFLKRYKLEFILVILITVLFFSSRLYNLLYLPIFTDEAIYIRWAQIANQDASWRFISLTDGKQPMFIWFVMIGMRIIKDPLFAARTVSIVAGFFTLIGLFFLGFELFKKRWIGILSSLFYLIYPMGLLYDRMALYDSLVGTFAVWSAYFIVLLVRKLRLDIALILGMIMGGGVLTKTPGFFSVYLLPFSLILMDWKKSEILKRFFKWTIFIIIAIVLTYGYYSIIKLSPFFYIINEKNAIFVYPLKDWLDHPFNFFVGNWKALWDWLTRYMTIPVLLLVAGSFFINRKNFFEKVILFIWFFIPFVALAVFGRTLYPRFILFMTLFLIPLAAFSIFHLYQLIKNKKLFYACLFLISFLTLRTDYLISKDITHSPIPVSDRRQYYDDWPSGGGVKEAVQFFKEQAEKGKIYVATQGTFGLMPYALEIYLVKNSNITIEGIWPIEDKIPSKVIEKSKKYPTYFVFYQPCGNLCEIGLAPRAWNLGQPVLKYTKTYGKRYLSIYRINP